MGIARRIAYLTGGQEWPARANDIAVFTAMPPASLAEALTAFGLSDVQQL